MNNSITTVSRERLEDVLDRAKKYTYKPDEWHRKNLAEACDSEFIEEMALSLLAVMDVKPVGKFVIGEHDGLYWPAFGEETGLISLYTTSPAPSLPDGLSAAVNRLLDVDGSRGTFSAIRRGDALKEVERLLAAGPAPEDC